MGNKLILSAPNYIGMNVVICAGRKYIDGEIPSPLGVAPQQELYEGGSQHSTRDSRSVSSRGGELCIRPFGNLFSFN